MEEDEEYLILRAKNYNFFALKTIILKKFPALKYCREKLQLLNLCGVTGLLLNFHVVSLRKGKKEQKKIKESNSGVGSKKTRSLRMKFVTSFLSQKEILIVYLQDN